MSDRPPRFSPEARNQLARLYNAALSGRLPMREYRAILEWLERSVEPLSRMRFEEVGVPGTRLFGVLVNPSVRIIHATQLPRDVRILVRRDESPDDVLIADIDFDTSFGD